MISIEIGKPHRTGHAAHFGTYETAIFTTDLWMRLGLGTVRPPNTGLTNSAVPMTV